MTASTHAADPSAAPLNAKSAAPVPVIEIQALHKAYGSLEVLKGVDVTAHPGQVIDT